MRENEPTVRVKPNWPSRVRAAERGDLRIEVEDAQGMVVYKPSEGLVTGISHTLTVVLLPKGSPALLEPAQIEAMLDRLSRLSVQNQRLKFSLGKLESQKPDFDQAIREWSVANGLPYQEVNDRIQSWAADVLAHRKEASLTKQAEAELGLRHFENAATLFQGAANTSKQALHQEQESYLTRRRTELRALFQASQQSAAAFQLAHQFDKATAMVDDSTKEADTERRRYPDDAALRDIWRWGSLLAEYARWMEGARDLTENGTVDTSRHLFTRAASDCRELLNQIDRSREPDKWEMGEVILAVTLIYQGEISNADQATEFRAQAVMAARSALEASDRKNDPKGWANLEFLTGLTLAAQAARGVTDEGVTFDQASPGLAQAVTAIRASFEVYSKSETPKEWARSQSTLAGLIEVQGLLAMAKGSPSAELFAQAAAGERAALDVFTRTEYPSEWAAAESGLGQTLSYQAGAEPGGRSHELLLQAVAAERAALEALSRQEDSRQWADTQSSLANILQNLAKHTTGSEAATLFTQSVAAFLAEFEVITRAGFPQRWARTKVSLGDSLALLGTRVAGTRSTELLAQAADAYRESLQVFTMEQYPQPWAGAQSSLAGALASLGVRTSGGQSIELFTQAARTYRLALQIIPKTDAFQIWPHDQAALGVVLATQSQIDAAHAAELLEQAESAFLAALEVYTKEANPHEWSATQRNFGDLLVAEGRRASGERSARYFARAALTYDAALQVDPKNSGALSSISTLYHDYILDFAKAYELTARMESESPSDSAKLNLAEADLTTSRFSDCLDLSNSIEDAKISDSLLPGQQTVLLACQWGAKQWRMAAQTTESLVRYATGMPKGGWITTGDRKFLGEAPEFQKGRSLWIQLFQALQDGNGASLAEAAHGLHDLIGN